MPISIAAPGMLALALGLCGFGPQAGAAGQAGAACDAGVATAGWPRVQVRVTGAHSAAGNVTLTLYGDDPARFLKHAGSLAIVRAPISGSEAQACMAVSGPGRYAIAIYHDENDNHHFDRTLLGLPAEGYGFSNDAPALLGPPSLGAAAFAVPAGGTRIAIRLRY